MDKELKKKGILAGVLAAIAVFFAWIVRDTKNTPNVSQPAIPGKIDEKERNDFSGLPDIKLPEVDKKPEWKERLAVKSNLDNPSKNFPKYLNLEVTYEEFRHMFFFPEAEKHPGIMRVGEEYFDLSVAKILNVNVIGKIQTKNGWFGRYVDANLLKNGVINTQTIAAIDEVYSITRSMWKDAKLSADGGIFMTAPPEGHELGEYLELLNSKTSVLWEIIDQYRTVQSETEGEISAADEIMQTIRSARFDDPMRNVGEEIFNIPELTQILKKESPEKQR